MAQPFNATPRAATSITIAVCGIQFCRRVVTRSGFSLAPRDPNENVAVGSAITPFDQAAYTF
jgi:hypothetical protein